MNGAAGRAIGHRQIFAPLLIGAFLFHCLIGFLLYRGRVVSSWRVCDSDLIVFDAPFAFALAGYAWILFASPWLRPRSRVKTSILLAVCLILVFLSTWSYMVLALNTYGS